MSTLIVYKFSDKKHLSSVLKMVVRLVLKVTVLLMTCPNKYNKMLKPLSRSAFSRIKMKLNRASPSLELGH